MKASNLAKKFLAIRSQAEATMSLCDDALEQLQPLVQAEMEEDGTKEKPVPRTFGSRRES